MMSLVPGTQAVTKINYAGVPAIAVFSSTFIGLVCCVINYVFPEVSHGNNHILNGISAPAASNLCLKRSCENAITKYTSKVIIIILSVLAYMFFSPAYSYETTLSLGVTSLVVV
jgi:GABA permease